MNRARKRRRDEPWHQLRRGTTERSGGDMRSVREERKGGSGDGSSGSSLSRHGSSNDITVRDITIDSTGNSGWQRDAVPADLPDEKDAIEKRVARARVRAAIEKSSDRENSMNTGSNADHGAVNPRETNSGNSETSPRNGVESLRSIAARSVASHSRDIRRMLLRNSNVSWELGWKLVWEWIRLMGLDSYPLFTLFLKEFGTKRDFHCHHRQTVPVADITGYRAGSKRDVFLDSRLLPSINTKHRIEYIPYGGVSGVVSLVQSISQYNLSMEIGNNIVLLDLSGLRIPRESLNDMCLSLTSLKSLAGLDVSGCGILESSNILTLWRVAMTSGAWTNLRLLCLGDSYLNSTTMSVYQTLFDTSLAYIEGPSNYTPDETKWVHGRNLTGISPRFTVNYSLAFKYRFLSSSANINEPRVRLPKATVLQEFILTRDESSPPWLSKRPSFNCRDCYIRKPTSSSPPTLPSKPASKSKLTIRKDKLRGPLTAQGFLF
ncbi:hypothetical protein AWJ20_4936 [Sugiyamaella lignohabitans]|uniref:Uncharacterized protein n=1 Tax=Sugiyamaella lignohabitans TaxID=796027 RepID=A0A167EEQ5_9ASCO|nr:uncharacterized protein AWJ20_4936 [Sugiyamaella lignohabitans]ANB13983.1 hypothetical protein AWJ20_4936 [Sugiyamaella lignohabitans]